MCFYLQKRLIIYDDTRPNVRAGGQASKHGLPPPDREKSNPANSTADCFTSLFMRILRFEISRYEALFHAEYYLMMTRAIPQSPFFSSDYLTIFNTNTSENFKLLGLLEGLTIASPENPVSFQSFISDSPSPITSEAPGIPLFTQLPPC
ncbi:hypothetical protein CIHG_06066 [Coccidioides immitis H538.4]|uniref:Uncharacterized protein n=3 Tax=Coccidioides immitis TaxID=5501 RepID=A0A0J8QY94_COCIT|nr:hypothetical protein CIRG_01812 [Coccidioides immitis RMSCC 2394]KMU76348.1 hypothetical protein CISG_01082 [Coccidioides immitis RMSCC 3703]KMU87673.1 hypothetical protein CIHG_06066 [Coccidioides immitis H538.4]